MPGTTVPRAGRGGHHSDVGWAASGVEVGQEPVVAVLTVLFTDIEGSTALTERLGDERWVEVLTTHDAAVRAALHACRGEEIKTTGDGFLAVFDHSADAVRAGLLARRLVGAVRVPEMPEGVRIRVGTHAGAVIRRAGDVHGRNVHLARRITAAARGGELLVSSSVKLGAGGEPGLRYGPVRTLRLQGISAAQAVFAVTAEADGEAPEGATVHLLDPGRRRATEASTRTR